MLNIGNRIIILVLFLAEEVGWKKKRREDINIVDRCNEKN